MSKLGDKVTVNRGDYKPLSGLGPAMSPEEKAAEALANAKKASNQVITERLIARDAGIIHQIRNSPTTDPILPASHRRSDAVEVPAKADITPRNTVPSTGKNR